MKNELRKAETHNESKIVKEMLASKTKLSRVKNKKLQASQSFVMEPG
jgi:hypothetical protein